MANEIFVDPAGMQTEIDSYRTSHEALLETEFTLNEKPAQPRSVGKYLDCTERMNEVLEAFTQLSEKETKSLEYMRAELLNMDLRLADQTIMDRIF